MKSVIDLIIFRYSRKFPSWFRNFSQKVYALLLDIRMFAQYGRCGMFGGICIEVNSDCNRACPYCPRSAYERKKNCRLGLPAIQIIIGQLKEVNFTGDINFTGYNEPLTDDRILEISHLFRMNFPKNKIRIYTNGDFLSPGLLEKFNADNILLHVTLHGPPQEAKKMFRQAPGNVLVRRDIDKSILSSRGGLVRVGIQENRDFCINPYTHCYIDCEGNVILCCDDYFSANVFGNIHEKNLMEIWFDDDFFALRKRIRRGRDLPDICLRCMDLHNNPDIDEKP